MFEVHYKNPERMDGKFWELWSLHETELAAESIAAHLRVYPYGYESKVEEVPYDEVRLARFQIQHTLV